MSLIRSPAIFPWDRESLGSFVYLRAEGKSDPLKSLSAKGCRLRFQKQQHASDSKCFGDPPAEIWLARSRNSRFRVLFLASRTSVGRAAQIQRDTSWVDAWRSLLSKRHPREFLQLYSTFLPLAQRDRRETQR
jgi:hypothetical protein